MQRWRSIIVEDLPTESKFLSDTLSKFCPEIEVVAVCESLDKAVNTIQMLKPQLLFLDVELGNENGFDLLKRIPNIDFTVIFVTAHPGFLLDALRVSAADYLLKPYTSDELRQAVDRAVLRQEEEKLSGLSGKLDLLLHNMSESKEQSKMIHLTNKDGQHRVSVSDILYCCTVKSDTAQGNISVRVEFRLTDGSRIVISNSSVSLYESMLSPFSFARISQSFLINLNQVKVYNKKSGTVTMRGCKDEQGRLAESQFEISGAKKEWFDKLYNQFVINS